MLPTERSVVEQIFACDEGVMRLINRRQRVVTHISRVPIWDTD